MTKLHMTRRELVASLVATGAVAAVPPAWAKRLFVAMARNAASPVEHFSLPSERTVTVGSQVPL